MNNPRQNRDNGMILVLVLWILFFLSLVLMSLSFNQRLRMRESSFRMEKMRINGLAREGLQRAFLRLSADRGQPEAAGIIRKQKFSLQTEAGLLSYEISDEESRLNLNLLPEDVLINLIVLNPEITPEVVKILVKERPFRLLTEIRRLPEITDEIFAGSPEEGYPGLNDLATVWSDGKINLNTAPPHIIACLGIPEETAVLISDRARTESFLDKDSLPQRLSELGLSPSQVEILTRFGKTGSSVYRISSCAVSARRKVKQVVENIIRREDQELRILLHKESCL